MTESVSQGGGQAVLELSDVRASYGGGGEDILRGTSLKVQAGEIVCLVGANGAGKSTVLRTVSGLTFQGGGSLRFLGEDMASVPAYERARRGIAHLPQGRSAVPFLTVRENLELGVRLSRGGGASPQDRTEQMSSVLGRLPELADRINQRAGTLSGGQQQMVEIGRALLSNPSLVMLDEPSLGLAPQIVAQAFALVEEMAASGLAVLMVEQRVKEGLDLADRAYVLTEGIVAFEGPSKDVAADPRLAHVYLGGAPE